MINLIKKKIENQIIRLKEWYDLFLFKKHKRKAVIPFDDTWFRGRRVAIIGGADSAYKDKLGEYIDGFDVVVRVNNGVRVIDEFNEFIGKRTDFLFHTLYRNEAGGGSPIELDLWIRHKVKKIVFSHHLKSAYGFNLREFVLSQKGLYQVAHLNEEMFYNNMNTIHPYHPTTGLIAVNSILLCEPLELYVSGITFFKTAHNQSYRSGSLEHWTKLMNSENSKHNPEEEYGYFKKLYSKNKNVFVLDKTLQEIIDNDK